MEPENAKIDASTNTNPLSQIALINKETKTTQFPSETEDSTTIQTANKTKPKFSLKTESP
jgi:hypothetical protein